MKMIRSSMLSLAMLFTISSNAQQLPPKGTNPVTKTVKKQSKKEPQKTNDTQSKLSITGGIGIANYVGDLINSSMAFQQSSYSVSAGLNYSIISHLNVRFDIGFHQVQGYDSKAGGAHPERNLSFKSKILEFSLAAEYTLLNMDKYRFSPYLIAGIGVFNFNPRAYYGAGGTHGLRELGTEGQGLAGYPGLYSKMAVEYPLGLGFKYAINKKIMLLGEFNYRACGTDYLDDVSTYYPDKTLLDARNPATAKFTYRGEGAYPKNPALKRGDASNKDGYYTTQLKIAYKLQAGKLKKSGKTEVTLPVKNNLTDSDEDGITDAFDKCPNLKGSLENSGCPLPFVEGAELINTTPDSMTYCIYFDLDRSILLPDAFKALKRIVQIMEADNALDVKITGHTDNLGTSAASMILSAERAQITKDYFISYNIAANRITTEAYGETKPIDTIQQWRNRRVELTLIKR